VDSADFLSQLLPAVEQKGADLYQQVLPLMKQEFGLFQTLFENLYNILLRKGLLDPDPYKDSAAEGIVIPPTGPFGEVERRGELGQRMAAFHTQLQHLNASYEFTGEFFDLERTRTCSQLATYVAWSNLTDYGPDFTTIALADLVQRVRKGGDTLSARIVTDTVHQLSRNTRSILGNLAQLAAFQKERYKLDIRTLVLPQLPREATLPGASRDSRARALKNVWQDVMVKRPFYPELATQVIDE